MKSPVADTIPLGGYQVRIDGLFHNFAAYDEVIPEEAPHLRSCPKRMESADVAVRARPKQDAFRANRLERHGIILSEFVSASTII